MTNKKMWDNSNLQEDIHWGNVQLPGLSDEELYKKNWTSYNIAKDPARNKKLSESSKKHWRSDNGKHQRSVLQKENWKLNRDTMAKSLKDRYVDGTLSLKISQSLKKSNIVKEKASERVNKIQTPDGIFNSRKEAAQFYNIHPTSMNKRMKTYPDMYYYTEVGNGATGYKKK